MLCLNKKKQWWKGTKPIELTVSWSYRYFHKFINPLENSHIHFSLNSFCRVFKRTRLLSLELLLKLNVATSPVSSRGSPRGVSAQVPYLTRTWTINPLASRPRGSTNTLKTRNFVRVLNEPESRIWSLIFLSWSKS